MNATIVRRFAVLVAVALLVGCVHPRPVQPPKTADRATAALKHQQPPRDSEKDTAEQYAVYSVILAKWPPYVLYSSAIDDYDSSKSEELTEPPDPNEVIVIAGKTTPASGVWPLDQTLGVTLDVQSATGDDFVEKNKRSAPVRPWFNVKAKCVIFTERMSRSIFGHHRSFDEEWKVFRKTFPNACGIATLSRVGFNTDYSQALLYFDYVAGAGGEGFIILLGKESGSWVIKRRVSMWVA